MERYFKNIFTSTNPSDFDQILNGIHINRGGGGWEESNGGLGRDFHASEVQQALKQMASLTAPGPDGMSPIFYKTFWHIAGDDVTTVVLNTLNFGVVPEAINTTFISLIPKIKNPRKASDFRPISLCNVIYKLIVEVVANRLKKFLMNTVPDSQSAFLSGQLITDNILVAFETLHYLKQRTKGKEGYMALKLDMSKAYDRVEWSFLEKLMAHVGLDRKMVCIIMSYLQTISYYVLLNGQLVGNIKPSRGLRQGDPLSPYLFLLCAMGLQSLIQQAEVDGSIMGGCYM